MKICFLLQRRFAYVGHKLAIALKEKYGINEFCGYVYLRPGFEFLKNQKEINYTALLLDEDIHNRYREEAIDLNYLQKFEKEYGVPNLWPYITLDRMIMFNLAKREYPYSAPAYSHEEMMKIFQVKAKAIVKFLEEEKPDLLFMTVIGTISSLLLYLVARKMGIKVLIGTETRIDNNYTLTENYENYSFAEKLFSELQKQGAESKKIKEARDYIKKFRDNPTPHLYFLKDGRADVSRLKELKWFLPKRFLQSLFWFGKLTFLYFYKRKWRDYTQEDPASYFIDRLRRKTRTLIGANRFYDQADLAEDFAFYPLHYEPEIATLLLAPFWTEQLNLIRQIAKSLPLHFKLYVKEHPAMVKYRPFSYYRELKKIPNVKLIDPNVKSFGLIKNSKLIITLTGTAAFEGLIFEKPIITFGDVFYNALPTVKHCHEIERLPFLVKEQLGDYRHNEKELETFIGAILETSAPVSLQEIWEVGINGAEEEKQLALLADLLMTNAKN
jgi:hypothetical protein